MGFLTTEDRCWVCEGGGPVHELRLSLDGSGLCKQRLAVVQGSEDGVGEDESVSGDHSHWYKNHGTKRKRCS